MNFVSNKPNVGLTVSQTQMAAGRIVIIYAIFACLWILLSDRAVLWLFSDPSQITFWSTLKGWLFVAVTSLLLFGLIQRLLSQVLNFSRSEREAQIERSKTQQLLEAIVYNSSDAIFAKDVQGRYLLFNREAARVTNKTSEEVLGKDDTALFPLKQAEMIRANDLHVIDLNQSTTYEELITTVDGERTYLATKGPLNDDHGQTFGMFGISRDITERKQVEEVLREGERLLKESQEIAHLGSYVFDITVGLWKSSGVLDRVFGIDASYVRTLAGWEALIHPDDRLMMGSYFNVHVLGQKQIFDKVYRIVRHDDQTPRWVHGLGKLEFDANGRLLKMFGTIQDITDRTEAEDKIHALAFSDPLTGLPNRRLLLGRLEHATVSALRHGHQGALLFVDMDDFKTLNDSLGHDMGDKLLQQTAQRLLTCVREVDTVARLGGDEFVVLLEDLDKSPQEAAKQAEVVGRKILSALRQPYQLDSHGYHSTASIGITLFGGAEREGVKETLKYAELAMYQAKSGGRDHLRFFEPEMRNAVNDRVDLETELHKAVAQAQFLLYYQAQVGRDARLTGVEALVRWLHPERGLISPAQFIPVAEANGLILPLGHWVLETACKQLAAWAFRPEMADLTISVNVSARQFRLPNFVEDVMSILDATGANPKRLRLELTESLLLVNMNDIVAKMTALKTSGVGFSLDDFGTGYSSLSYLKRLPLDELKIDQGFVRDILTDPHDAAIAKMVVALAEAMGLSVIAEGVETQAQHDALAALGCYAYQGYLYSKPLPVDAFEALARNQSLQMNTR